MATEQQLDEAARAHDAYLVLKKHFECAGVAIKHDDLPGSWFSFSWLFYLNLGGNALARARRRSAPGRRGVLLNR